VPETSSTLREGCFRAQPQLPPQWACCRWPLGKAERVGWRKLIAGRGWHKNIPCSTNTVRVVRIRRNRRPEGMRLPLSWRWTSYIARHVHCPIPGATRPRYGHCNVQSVRLCSRRLNAPASDANRSRVSNKEFQLSAEVELPSFRIFPKLSAASAIGASQIEPYLKMAFCFSWSDLC